MVQAKARYWELLWHYRRFACGIFILAALGTYAAFYMQPTVYKVQADLYLQPRPVIGEQGSSVSGARLNDQLEILRSDRVRKKAFETIRAHLGKRLRLSPAELQQALTVAQRGTSSVIALEMHAPVSPRDLQTMVSEYIQAYQGISASMDTEASRRELAFWQHAVEKAQQHADTANAALRQFESAHPALNGNEAMDRLGWTSSFIESQLWGVKADLAANTAEIAATTKLMPFAFGKAAALSRVDADLEAGELRRRVMALEMARAEWAAQVPETDPKRLILSGELERAKSLLAKRLQTLANAFGQKEPMTAEDVVSAGHVDEWLADRALNHQLHKDALTAKAQSLEDARKQLHRPAQRDAKVWIDYTALLHESRLAEEALHRLRQRLDDVALTQDMSQQFRPVEILNNPDLRAQPVHPPMALHLLLSGLAGLLLALCSVGLRVAVDHRLRGSFQLSELAEKRVFCLDRLPSRKTLSTLLERGNFNMPEPYQRLLLYLETLSQSENIRRIGLMPVGSFVERAQPMVSLSLYCTEPGHKVAFIDTDFSKHSASRLIESLGTPLSAAIGEGPGLSDYLGGEAVDFVDIIYPLGKTVYGSLIPSGEPVSGAAAQKSRRGVLHLEEQLSPNYNFVFYALPSLAESYDSVAVGRILDGVMLVVYPGMSSLAQIKRAIQELDAVDARLLGIIVQPV